MPDHLIFSLFFSVRLIMKTALVFMKNVTQSIEKSYKKSSDATFHISTTWHCYRADIV